MPSRARLPRRDIAISSQLRRHARRYAIGTVLLGLYQYSQYWFDTRLQIAIDSAYSGAHADATSLGIALAAVAAVAFGVRVLSRTAIFNAGRIAEYELRGILLDHLQRLGPGFYARMSAGEIISRSTNDLAQVRLLLGFGVLNLVNTLFALVSALSVTLRISVPLTLASLAMLPLLLVVTRTLATQSYSRQRDNQEALGAVSSCVQSSLAGVRVVRAFGLEGSELQRFDDVNDEYTRRSLSLARLRGSFGPVMQAISAVGLLIVFWYGGELMLRGEIEPGGFLAFYRALARLTWPLMALGFLVGIVQRGRAAYSRLRELYEAEPEVVGAPGPVREDGPGHLRVVGLSQRYGERTVLDDVSFELAPGESLAIVGRTGSGKSTLATLLARLQPAPSGSVWLDGRDVRDLPLSYVRGVVGYAHQTAFLFSTTVARNIGFALPRSDDADSRERVVRAARQASVYEEIATLPDGLETIVGERGVQLSGGQKQRVSLARALLSQARILILDDPLSAVDARTELAILEALDDRRSESSLILVTHRVAAAARCDRVLVLDQGRIVEQGRHEELVARPGLYASFAEEQRLASELEELSVGDGSTNEGQPT